MMKAMITGALLALVVLAAGAVSADDFGLIGIHDPGPVVEMEESAFLWCQKQEDNRRTVCFDRCNAAGFTGHYRGGVCGVGGTCQCVLTASVDLSP